jgi:uncharacterized membrane protein
VHGFAAGTDGAGGGVVSSVVGTDDGGQFTDRLVAKFGLPVAGWRGRGPRGG